jgi:hypothetical protein
MPKILNKAMLNIKYDNERGKITFQPNAITDHNDNVVMLHAPK